MRAHFALCLCTLLSVSPIYAADGPLHPVEPPKTGRTAARDAAVVIGIARYTDLAPVPFADRDAQLFHRFLLDTVGVPTAQISNLHARPASREAIEREVKRQAQKARGTLWLYFGGHGASTKDGDALLIGRDAGADNLNARSVRRSELVKWAQGSRAKRVVVVLDACFSGKDRSGKSLTGERFAVPTTFRSAPRVVVWTGTTGAQTAGPLGSMRQGLFTYFAVGALSGWAADTRGQVTLGGAARWVGEAMGTAQSVLQRDQTPTVSGPKGWDRWKVASVRRPKTAPDLRRWSLEGSAPAPRPTGAAETHLGGEQTDFSALAAHAAATDATARRAEAARAKAAAAMIAERERRLDAAAQDVQASATRDFQAIRALVDRPTPAGRPVMQKWLARYGKAGVSVDGTQRPVEIPETSLVRAALRRGPGETSAVNGTLLWTAAGLGAGAAVMGFLNTQVIAADEDSALKLTGYSYLGLGAAAAVFAVWGLVGPGDRDVNLSGAFPTCDGTMCLGVVSGRW
jgi:hypothetical protein